MSRGLTIADFVQQVLYAMYKVRLDVDASKEGSFHSKSDKFKEIVMEGNFVLQEFQKEQDWHFLREKWMMGPAVNPPHGIQELPLPPDAYKLCMGFNDAVRLHRPEHHHHHHHHHDHCNHGHYPHRCHHHHHDNTRVLKQIPFDEARSGSHEAIDMFDSHGFANVDKDNQRAFVVGDVLTFYRRWYPGEIGKELETDYIRYIEPMHICDDNCEDNCELAYKHVRFRWMPDPYYFVIKTAAKRALADPSCADVAQAVADDATKFLSSMRNNASAHTHMDTYETSTLGYISVL